MSMRKSKRAVAFMLSSLAKRCAATSQVAQAAALFGLLLSGLAGCSQASAPLQPSIFTNSNEVTLVCFDGRASRNDVKEWSRLNPDWDPTLPLDCCDKVIGEDAEAIAAKLERCGRDATPIGHALVTQVQRGEVAAVDLENKRVLDSNSKIPGYSFVDVGGLPAAIAIPREIKSDDPAATVVAVPGKPNPVGPLWTYVVGRQTNSVRAVPTCRFSLGKECGPEVAFPDAQAFTDATERALAGEPHDMVLAGDGKGLWISLPDEGLLAYVALPGADNKLTDPFPEEIVYYPLPGGYDVKPPSPEAEMDPYRFACAARTVDDTDVDAGAPTDDPAPFAVDTLQMPLSVPADSTRTPRPTLLRMVEISEREAGTTLGTQLLFVADEAQMALHVYAQDEAGELSLTATLPVGAPLRDFAVTPEVPALGPTYEQLIDGAYYESEGVTKRYLYAIDERDGSLMAFALRFEEGVPSIAPLLAPEPARDGVHRTLNHADRLSLGGDGFVARALDVVDTRARKRSDGSKDDAICQVELTQSKPSAPVVVARDTRLAELESIVDKKKSAYKEAKASYDTASASGRDGEPLENLKSAQADYINAAEELSVLTNASAISLRGVFLMVATTRGQLVAIDVHDLDLECRAKQQCAVEPDVAIGVAIQRHTVRISGTSAPVVTVSPSTELSVPSTDTGKGFCPTGYVEDEDGQLCVSGDPWVAHGISFAVNYEGAITGQLQNGVLEPASKGRVIIKAPEGVDLCARGANAEDRLLVGILSVPDDKTRSPACTVTSFSAVPRLRVVEARRDQLLVEPLPDDITSETLLSCYREFVSFDLRLDDQYFVSSAAPIGYQHSNMSAADGTCVRDESLDARFTSRAQLDQPFVNQFVAFTLRSTRAAESDAGGKDEEPDAGMASDDAGADEPPPEEGDAGDDADAMVSAGDSDGSTDDRDAGPGAPLSDAEVEAKKEVNPSISMTNLTETVIRSIAGSNSRSDTLPHRVRYFPENGYLFVVDQASQGLRRFFLTPRFEADEKSNFR